MTAVKPTRLFTNELLDHYRQLGDAPADAVIQAVVEQEGKPGLGRFMRWLAAPVALGKPHDAFPYPVVTTFFEQYGHIPTWADQRRMERSLAFYRKHARAIGLSLGLYSLPYCYLAADGAQVLWLTERIKSDAARRLAETGEWVFGITNPKEWESSSASAATAGLPMAIFRTLKIRLIHASARWYSLNSSRWNMEWGTPINQEDMAGTNGAFSYIVLRGLRKLGITATEQEEEDYLHFFNVVGYVNGVNEELMPQNLREAFSLDKLMVQRQFEKSEAGIGLTKALLKTIEQQAGFPTAWNIAAAQMRFFLGDMYADMLELPTVRLEKQLVSAVTRLPIFKSLEIGH